MLIDKMFMSFHFGLLCAVEPKTNLIRLELVYVYEYSMKNFELIAKKQ